MVQDLDSSRKVHLLWPLNHELIHAGADFLDLDGVDGEGIAAGATSDGYVAHEAIGGLRSIQLDLRDQGIGFPIGHTLIEVPGYGGSYVLRGIEVIIDHRGVPLGIRAV